MLISDLAKICHEANKAYCESQDDYSEQYWKDSSAWERDSAIEHVEYFLKMIASGSNDLPENSPMKYHLLKAIVEAITLNAPDR